MAGMHILHYSTDIRGERDFEVMDEDMNTAQRNKSIFAEWKDLIHLHSESQQNLS
jgi:hypothetical protein